MVWVGTSVRFDPDVFLSKPESRNSSWNDCYTFGRRRTRVTTRSRNPVTVISVDITLYSLVYRTTLTQPVCYQRDLRGPSSVHREDLVIRRDLGCGIERPETVV